MGMQQNILTDCLPPPCFANIQPRHTAHITALV